MSRLDFWEGMCGIGIPAFLSATGFGGGPPGLQFCSWEFLTALHTISGNRAGQVILFPSANELGRSFLSFRDSAHLPSSLLE